MYPRIVIQSLYTLNLSCVCNYTEGITQSIKDLLLMMMDVILAHSPFYDIPGFIASRACTLLFYHSGRNSLKKRERKTKQRYAN